MVPPSTTQAMVPASNLQLPRPSRWAIAAASVLLPAPSLAMMLETWTLAALLAMKSVVPISLLLCPAAIRRSTPALEQRPAQDRRPLMREASRRALAVAGIHGDVQAGMPHRLGRGGEPPRITSPPAGSLSLRSGSSRDSTAAQRAAGCRTAGQLPHRAARPQAARQDGKALPWCLRGEFGHQARLADAGVAADQHHNGLARRSVGEQPS
jgi:hypothetical protein